MERFNLILICTALMLLAGVTLLKAIHSGSFGWLALSLICSVCFVFSTAFLNKE
jgi:hypothetical protein